MQNQMFDAGFERGADLSVCRKYRYLLWRHWRRGDPCDCVMFVGLNPSTADETNDDPTLRRCIGFAKAWGYAGLFMLNAYAFRATDPKDMLKAEDPVGPKNDDILREFGQQCGLVVACWGSNILPGRAQELRRIIGRQIHCLGVNADGSPKHPLYLKSDTLPGLWH